MKTKSNQFKFSFIDSWKFISESKKYIWSILIIFLIMTFLGFFFPIFFIEQIKKLILELISLFYGLSLSETILMILGNNLKASLTAIIFGIIFGIVPLLATMFNGYLVGFTANSIIPEYGYVALWRLIPHGIFELPAVFISFGLGLKIGIELFNKNSDTRRNLIESLKVFFIFIIPLLIIAAIIEGLLMFFGV